MTRDTVVGIVLVVSLTACGADRGGFSVETDPHQLIRSVQLSEHAYNLATEAPYNRVQLHVTALLQDGTPLAEPPVYTTRTIDDAVSVDSAGLVTVRRATSGRWVYVSATHGNVTRTDSAIVAVVEGAPLTVVHHVGVAPPPGDSATQALVWPDVFFTVGGKFMSVGAYDANGSAVDVQVSLRSSDTTVAAWSLGTLSTVNIASFLYPRRAGQTWLTVSTFANGKEFRDSLLFHVGVLRFYVNGSSVVPIRRNGRIETIVAFEPDTLTVPVGSDIVFGAPLDCAINADGTPKPDAEVTTACTPLDVIFDDSTAAKQSTRTMNFNGLMNSSGGSGNIPAFRWMPSDPETFKSYGREARFFDRLGVHRYHNSMGGTGVIVVLSEADYLAQSRANAGASAPVVSEIFTPLGHTQR